MIGEIGEYVWKKFGKTFLDTKGIKQAIYGRIRTHNKVSYTKRHGYRHWKDRILKQKISNKDRCCRVDLWRNGKHKTILVHRLVATTFLEDLIDTDITVNHKDGNRLNNKIDNLEWLSLGDNIRHGFNNNLYPQKNCKLIDENGKEYNFTSISKASIFLGRNNKYISACLKLNRKILDKEGKEYKIIINENPWNNRVFCFVVLFL